VEVDVEVGVGNTIGGSSGGGGGGGLKWRGRVHEEAEDDVSSDSVIEMESFIRRGRGTVVGHGRGTVVPHGRGTVGVLGDFG